MVPSAASALFRSLDGYAIYGNFFSRHDEVYGWYPPFCHWANSASWSSVQYGPPGGNHDARNGFAAIVQRKSRKTWLKDDLVQSASSYACLISFVPTPSCAVT